MSVTTRATEQYTALMAPSTSQYKGKLSNRSWQQLPPEIIRYVFSLSQLFIATHTHTLAFTLSLGGHGSETLTYPPFSKA